MNIIIIICIFNAFNSINTFNTIIIINRVSQCIHSFRKYDFNGGKNHQKNMVSQYADSLKDNYKRIRLRRLSFGLLQ